MQNYLETISNANTKRAYENDIARFEHWRGAQQLELADLRVRHLLAYRDYLTQTLAPASVNRAFSAVRDYLRWAAQMELVPAEVYAASVAVKGVKQAKKLPNLVTDDEFDALICQPDPHTEPGARDIAFFRLLRSSGVRVGEAVAIRIEQLQFDYEDNILVGGQVKVDGKGAKQRVVLFDADTASAILHYLALRGFPTSGALFVNQHGCQVTDRWMRERLAEYGAKIGRSDLHPHLLRHTFATWLLDETGDEDTVRGLLGHEDTRTLRIYTQLATSRYKKVYRRASNKSTFTTSTSFGCKKLFSAAKPKT